MSKTRPINQKLSFRTQSKIMICPKSKIGNQSSSKIDRILSGLRSHFYLSIQLDKKNHSEVMFLKLISPIHITLWWVAKS